jgi:DnaJ-class molecular chaperone
MKASRQQRISVRTLKMRGKKPEEEIDCEACNGTGFPPVAQTVPGRRVYPAPCKKCGGKGRLKAHTSEEHT